MNAIIGEIRFPDLKVVDNMPCNIDAFSGYDCFLSAYGDLDRGQTITGPGGPCNDTNTSTSAQEEVQKVMVNAIPKYVNNNKGVITGEIKYTNQEYVPLYLFDSPFPDLLDNYTNCGNLNIDFNDEIENITDLRYNSDVLNCTICALKDYLVSICPSGKVICSINLWGDILTGGYIKWVGEVYFCNATVVPWESEPNPEIIPDGNGILGSNSILSI